MEVLLVDDNEDDVVLIEAALDTGRLINPIHVAANGRDAQAYLRCGASVGLILLDLNMPVMDGYEFLAWHRHSEFAHIPVVVLTTSAAEEDIIKSYKDGAATFITKPPTFAELQKCLAEFSMYWSLVAKLPPR